MHDIKAIRDDPDAFDRAWASRGLAPQTAAILALDERHRAAQTALQAAQTRRNEASKLIGAAKAKKDESRAAELMAEVEVLKGEMARLADEEREAGRALHDLLATLPNRPAPEVPEGSDEHGNAEVRRWGEPFAISNPKDHVALGEAMGLMDFEAAARMSGARFVVLKGELARLERAIGQFMLDMQTVEHGYTEVNPPLLVRDEAAFGTGQLPKFAEDLFKATNTDWQDYKRNEELGREVAWLPLRKEFPDLLDEDGNARVHTPLTGERAAKYGERYSELTDRFYDDLMLRFQRGDFDDRRWLIPTAEVSLTNLVREQITAEDALPMRVTALTPCFRSEAGASGRDTRGMIRQHQFYKCELVSITTPEQSEDEHERMTACAEAVLRRLELPYRTMLLCTGDMGFTARKTYDLEVWLPSEGRYREISSCSNCGDFQARRMDARCRRAGEKGTRFVHTLNGSGLAVGRTLVAILENYQDEGGRIAVPQALHPYMRGATHIGGRA